MTRFTIRLCGAMLVWGSLSLVATLSARSADRTAEEILGEIDAVTVPELDAAKQKNRAYVQQVTRKRKDAAARKSKLIGELYRVDPTNPRLVELLPERWRARYAALAGASSAKEMTGELSEVLSSTESEELKKEAAYWRAKIAVVTARGDAAKVKAVDEFTSLDPKDARGAELLATLVSKYLVSPAVKQAITEWLAADYPDTSKPDTGKESAPAPAGAAVGKPFDLEFIDAISGSPVSTQRLKGKVLVIDFWATWCGPCVAEMPRMKDLYAAYGSKGVQFIGVSLDQPGAGLEKLQAFVLENGISWPQYYQGNGWESEFSKAWNIRAIPAVFVVDREGEVYSDKARGKIEKILSELLSRPATKVKTGARAG